MSGYLHLLLIKDGKRTSKWLLEQLTSEELIDGLIYGTFYGLRNAVDVNNYIIEAQPRGVKYEIDFVALTTDMYQAPLEDYVLGRVDNLLVLRSIVDPAKKTYVTTKNSAKFIQGLMTALNLYNIDIKEVLLAKPYSRGVHYNVETM